MGKLKRVVIVVDYDTGEVVTPYSQLKIACERHGLSYDKVAKALLERGFYVEGAIYVYRRGVVYGKR